MGEWGVPPLPVLSPCSKLDVVLGTGALFDVEFVSFAEARIISGIRSGRSWITNCGELHPPTLVCQSRTQVGGFLDGLWGAHPLDLLMVSNRLEWYSRRIWQCSICSIRVRFIIREFHFHILWGRSGDRIGIILKGG